MSAPDLYRLPPAARQTAAGIYLGAVATVVSVIGLAVWAATQYAAYRLRFHPALGVPLFWVSWRYREFLSPAAVVMGVLGAACVRAPGWRRVAVVPFGAAALLIVLYVGPLYWP